MTVEQATGTADLNAIHIFVAVVNCGSLSGAAAQLQLPKSTVSRKLAALEQRLGVRLLQRTTRKLRLTPAGTRYFERVQLALADVLDAEQELVSQQSIPAGLLRVSVAYEFAAGFLTELVQDFLAQYPQVKLQIDVSPRLVDLVADGIDVAIRGGPLQDSSLIARRLGPGIGVVCASPSYLANAGRPQHPRELLQHQCIYRAGEPREQHWVFQVDGELARIAVDGAYGVSDRGLIKQAAMHGLGLALLPAYMVAEELHAGQLEQVLTEWMPEAPGVYLVYPNRQLSAAARAFINFTGEAMEPPPWVSREYLPTGCPV